MRLHCNLQLTTPLLFPVERILTLIGLVDPELTHLPDLPALHAFVQEDFLPITSERLAEAKAERRPGRPPSKEELLLQELEIKEQQEYKTGIELPDLTDPINVRILRDWDGDAQGLPLFRMIRIAGATP